MGVGVGEDAADSAPADSLTGLSNEQGGLLSRPGANRHAFSGGKSLLGLDQLAAQKAPPPPARTHTLPALNYRHPMLAAQGEDGPAPGGKL